MYIEPQSWLRAENNKFDEEPSGERRSALKYHLLEKGDLPKRLEWLNWGILLSFPNAVVFNNLHNLLQCEDCINPVDYKSSYKCL